jgi:hypothetical protein
MAATRSGLRRAQLAVHVEGANCHQQASTAYSATGERKLLACWLHTVSEQQFLRTLTASVLPHLHCICEGLCVYVVTLLPHDVNAALTEGVNIHLVLTLQGQSSSSSRVGRWCWTT